MTEPLTTSCGLSARSDAKRHICPIRNLVTLLVQYRYVLCYETKPYMIGSGQDSAKHPSEATIVSSQLNWRAPAGCGGKGGEFSSDLARSWRRVGERPVLSSARSGSFRQGAH